MRVYKPINYIRYGDIGIRISEIIHPQKCNVPGCQESECYDVQFEKPDNCSFMGGTFCKNHLKCIFNFSILPKGHRKLIAEPTEEDIAKIIGGQNDFADCIREAVKTVFANAPAIMEDWCRHWAKEKEKAGDTDG